MKKTDRFTLRIEPELRKRLERMAEFEDVSMSDMVRRLIKMVPVIGSIENGRVIWSNNEKPE